MMTSPVDKFITALNLLVADECIMENSTENIKIDVDVEGAPFASVTHENGSTLDVLTSLREGKIGYIEVKDRLTGNTIADSFVTNDQVMNDEMAVIISMLSIL